MLAAMDARRSKEHHRVLDVLCLEAAKRLEIFGQNPQWSRFFTIEKLVVEVCQRLRVHWAIMPWGPGDRGSRIPISSNHPRMPIERKASVLQIQHHATKSRHTRRHLRGAPTDPRRFGAGVRL